MPGPHSDVEPAGRSGIVRVPWRPGFHRESPLFASVARFAARFDDFDDFPPVSSWNARLADRVPVRFEPQRPRARRRAALDRDALYDARITRDAIVPSREGHWHDYLNALVWAAFPRAKRALHARQHRAIDERIEPSASRLPPSRTRELDALALLDEGGVIIARDARTSYVASVFGHAILEALVAGTRLGTARAATVWCHDDLDAVDVSVEARLKDPRDLLDPDALERIAITPSRIG